MLNDRALLIALHASEIWVTRWAACSCRAGRAQLITASCWNG
jgi:hypothetical protein